MGQTDGVAAAAAGPMVRAASQRGDAEAVRALVSEMGRGLRSVPPEVAERLRAEIVEALARVGERTAAWERLDRMRVHHPTGVGLLVASVSLHARHGDPDLAVRLGGEALRHPRLGRRERWRLRLLRALAAHRLDDPRAGGWTTDAVVQGARLDPRVPSAREPQVLRQIGGLVDDPECARLLADLDLAVEVRTLGGFALRRGGRPVEVPSGAGLRVVKRVAVGPRPVPVDEVTAEFWPDETGPEARDRLRRALRRFHDHAGTVAVVGRTAIDIADGVVVDIDLFRRDAKRALALADAHGSEPTAVAAAAAVTYRGPLLPGEPYSDWAAGPREEIRRLHLDLESLRERRRRTCKSDARPGRRPDDEGDPR